MNNSIFFFRLDSGSGDFFDKGKLIKGMEAILYL